MPPRRGRPCEPIRTDEQRVRLELPLPTVASAQAEVAMTGTIVDGRFAGAHGSVRDISERERLEGDLREPGRRAGRQPGARATSRASSTTR